MLSGDDEPISADDDVPLQTTPLRPRMLPADTQSLYEYIHELLSDPTTKDNITEAQFRARVREHMMERQIKVDDTKLNTRLRSAGADAKEVEDDLIALDRLKARWERRRQQFLTEQIERRRERSERAGRLRSRAVIPDSDEEFDIPEPVATTSASKLVAAAAHTAYEGVRTRFELERERDKRKNAEERKEQRNDTRRALRRSEVMSTVQAFASPPPAPASDASSSIDASSSSSPQPKRKFTAAAVTGVYTHFMMEQTKQSFNLAMELKEGIKRREEKEDEYREKKLKNTEAYRAQKLEILRTGKENVNPNQHSV
jgi:hypothetical protein